MFFRHEAIIPCSSKNIKMSLKGKLCCHGNNRLCWAHSGMARDVMEIRD